MSKRREPGPDPVRAGPAGAGPSVSGTDWSAWGLPPDLVIGRHLAAAPRGDLLYAGPLTEERARWLLRSGFAVEVVAPGAPGVVEWPSPPAGVGAVLRVDPMAPALPAMRYAFVVLDGALNLLPTPAGDRLLAAVRGAVRPGGLVYAAAYTLVDADGPAAGPRCERLLARGELAMAFHGWLLLHLVEGQARDGAGRERPTSVLVARRPSGGTLLT